MIAMPVRLGQISILALGLTCGTAGAHVLYFNDFQSATNDGHWSVWRTEDTPTPYPGPVPRSFLGQFGNESVRFSTALGGYTGQLLLEFDLYLIRTWDGSSIGTPYDYGNDAFQVSLGAGPVLFNETFSNGNPAGQSFGPAANNAPMTGAVETYSLGYTFWDGTMGQSYHQDAVYRLALTFTQLDPSLQIDFTGLGLQTIDDESWGLDNVRLTWLGIPAASVPLPGILPLLGLGLIALTAVLRRQDQNGRYNSAPT